MLILLEFTLFTVFLLYPGLPNSQSAQDVFSSDESRYRIYIFFPGNPEYPLGVA